MGGPGSGRRRLSVCGTDGGYHYHRLHHQPACARCLRAHAEATARSRWVPEPWDVSDIGPGYEAYREMADSMGLDPWAGAA